MAAHVDKDPLTWSFVKLFACQITQELGEFEGVPGSHAWKWQRDGIWRARLVTKAQVVGVLVSVHERTERVEFLVDDGTALVKAVRWSSVPWDNRVALGDLVHVQGKLNTDKCWRDGARPDREIRVAHISRVEDPNEELLHWADALELAQSVYSAAASQPQTANASAVSLNGPPSSAWEQVAAGAFFELAVDTDARTRFVRRDRREPHDEILVETLEALVVEQRQRQQQSRQDSRVSDEDASGGGGGMKDALAVRVTFTEALEHIAQQQQQGSAHEAIRTQTIRRLRKTFAALRSAGLLFLEDTDADRHVLLSFALSLAPALLQLLRDSTKGLSVAELTERVVAQRKFQRLPLAWVERSLQRLLGSGHVVQREDSQRFHLA